MAYDFDPEKYQQGWAGSQPSNLQIIGAFAPSEHLKLFELGNKNSDKIYVLASTRDNARIIAMLGGHINHMQNATFWKHPWEPGEFSVLDQAIHAGMPGRVSIHSDYVITRDKVFYGKRANRKQ